jgi:hypothetical protein
VHLDSHSGEKVGGGAWPTWYLAYTIEVSATGTVFQQSGTQVVARFGYDLADSELVNRDGDNILAVSQETYGEREITISTDAFALTPEQAQEIAQALDRALGEIRDIYGELAEVIRFPEPVLVIAVRSEPVVHVGDRVAFVGQEWQQLSSNMWHPD